MPTFRTKPRTVEAFQWNGQELSQLPHWAKDPRYVELLSQGPLGLRIYTKHGPVTIVRGMWLIQDDGITISLDEDFSKWFEAVE